MSKPLDGIKVVELGTFIAIPKAARILADWGASVIKVESFTPDAWRTTGKSWNVPCEPDYNPLYQPDNGNKRGIVLNLKSPEGKEAMLKLLKDADVFLTNTRPKGLKSLGFSYEEVKKINEKIIFVSFSGFGEKGPDRDRPGFDVAAFWANSGTLIEWSTKESGPFKPTAGFGDGTNGAIIAAGILAALFRRERTGLGENINTSLYAAALFYNASGIIQGQPQFGLKYPRSRYELPSPSTPLYKTKDEDWVLLSVPNWDGKYADILKVIGLEEYIGDKRFADITEARKDMKFVIDTLDKGFAQTSTADLSKGLIEADIVFERLKNPAELYTDPQAWENNYLREITLENGEKVVVPNNPIQFDSISEYEYTLAPHMGANTTEVLKEYGYDDATIKKMIESKAAMQE